jgi:glycolate oxidase FAD binding subunit
VETLRPAKSDDVTEAIRWALAGKQPLEIVAAGSKRAWGKPVDASAGLDLSGLSGIRLYEPDELVLTALPATPIREIETLLAETRQRLAFEPPDLGPLLGAAAGQGTLGGAIACNASGPRRPFAGAARDHLLGFKAVSGRGETFKSGGRVMKNVTGFDLSKLMAGSFGTLAVLTEVTIKVLPAPESTRTLVLRGLDVAKALAAMTTAQSGPFDVSGAVHLPEEDMTALRLEGPAPSVAARAASLTAKLGHKVEEGDPALWKRIRDVEPFVGAADPVWRLSIPPASLAAVVAALPKGRWFCDWGGGLVWYQGAGEATAIRAALKDGGHATLIRAPEALRRATPVFEPQAEPLAALAARVKEAFDPGAILNPGRLG